MDTGNDASQTPAVIGVAVMLLTLSTSAVILRLFFRRTTNQGLWYDDYTIIVALVLSWVSPITNLVSLRYGLGQHTATLRNDQVTDYLKLLYAFEVIWTFTIPLIKLSLLLLFNRLFPIKPVRIATYIVGFFVTSWLLWAEIATIVQCTPVAFFWDKTRDGHCINNDAFYISTGAVNVINDFATLAIPIPVIFRLQKLSMAKKLGIVGVFTLGGWVCIVSIIRLVYLSRISTDDFSWTDGWGTVWSSIEVSLDIVAACLPVIVPGFFALCRSNNLSWSSIKSMITFSRTWTLVEKSIASHRAEDEGDLVERDEASRRSRQQKPGTLPADLELGESEVKHT